jgi:hypothetical protein
MKPIWFFVGIILLAMGGIIFITGIVALFTGSKNGSVLYEIHPDIWWGALMIIVGLIYFIKNKNVKIE